MSILGPDWVGRRFLDCFAGSGANGFEALSRGAEHVSFIERSAIACRTIASTAQALGVAEQVAICQGDAKRVIESMVGRTLPVDILFFDPPYADDVLQEAMLASLPLGGPGARFVCEHAAGPAPEVQGLIRLDARTYGGTSIAIYSAEDGL